MIHQTHFYWSLTYFLVNISSKQRTISFEFNSEAHNFFFLEGKEMNIRKQNYEMHRVFL